MILQDNIKRVMVESIRVASQRAISGEFMQRHLNFETFIEEEMQYVVAQLETYVRRQVLPPEEISHVGTLVLDEPASWWHAWKIQVGINHWWSRWLVNWKPPKLKTKVHKLTVTVDLRAHRMFPDAPNIGSIMGQEVLVYDEENTAVTANWRSYGN